MLRPTAAPTTEPAALLHDVEWREWLCAQPVARFATLNRRAAPHLVPVVFVLLHDALWLPVDGKPKHTSQLARLANLRRDARCALLFDDYREDWGALRWLRLDGDGEVLTMAPAAAAELTAALRRKYPQYAAVEPLPAPATAIRFTWTKATRWRAAVG